MMGKRGPKATDPEKRISAPLSLRLHPEMKRELEEEAKRNGRSSLGEEIRRRLQKSLDYDLNVQNAFGTEQNYMLMRMASIPLTRNKDWLNDPEQFTFCLASIIELFSRLHPSGREAWDAAAIEYIKGHNGRLFGDALWSLIKDVDPSKPRKSRTDFEHIAINAKMTLGEYTNRADWNWHSRKRAVRRLKEAFPDEDFSELPDAELFQREDDLISDSQEDLSNYLGGGRDGQGS